MDDTFYFIIFMYTYLCMYSTYSAVHTYRQRSHCLLYNYVFEHVFDAVSIPMCITSMIQCNVSIAQLFGLLVGNYHVT